MLDPKDLLLLLLKTLLDELRDASPSLALRVARLAAAWLPREYRSARLQEWTAVIEQEIPGKFAKLVYALGLLPGAVALRHQHVQRRHPFDAESAAYLAVLLVMLGTLLAWVASMFTHLTPMWAELVVTHLFVSLWLGSYSLVTALRNVRLAWAKGPKAALGALLTPLALALVATLYLCSFGAAVAAEDPLWLSIGTVLVVTAHERVLRAWWKLLDPERRAQARLSRVRAVAVRVQRNHGT